MLFGAFVISSCTTEKTVTEEIEVAAATFSISGVLTYLDGIAGGAIVNLIGDVTAKTVSLTNGTYSFKNLLPGSYSVYAIIQRTPMQDDMTD